MNLKQKELLKIEKEMKKNYVKGMLFCILQDDNSIFTNQIFSSESEAEDYAIRCNNKRKKIKKILRKKHPGYEKNSIDGEAFDSACETISFYLTRGRVEEARAVLKVLPFVPISLSEKEIENIIQEYKKKDRY